VAIVASDILWQYSGGVGNTDPNASLGGVRSTAGGGTIDDGVLHDLFDAVSSAESTPGDTEYRGGYILNNHGSLTLIDARLYFTTAADDLDIAIAAEAVSTTMATIANESTAPATVTFSHPTSYAAGLQLNSATGLAAGAFRGFWVRRIIPALAPAESAHTETLKVEGDTSG
jgi:hypothetical protein